MGLDWDGCSTVYSADSRTEVEVGPTKQRGSGPAAADLVGSPTHGSSNAMKMLNEWCDVEDSRSAQSWCACLESAAAA
jgi:hypothetical protein